MYRIAPIGLNLKPNDRDVKDGFLQESINLQWRNDSFKPIPERVLYDINIDGYSEIIFHKVGDENTINVLGFKDGGTSNSLFLAFDLADYLAYQENSSWALEWLGTITDGEYQSRAAIQIPVFFTPGMSFTILNGMVYFMGDGSTAYERYYYRLQFNEITGTYETKDMYAWKSLIPFYPEQDISTGVGMRISQSTYNYATICGVINYRFALVLKTGEVVLPSPIYCSLLIGLNALETASDGTGTVDNIHTVINLNLDFSDTTLLKNEISAINVYASVPSYNTKLPKAAGSALLRNISDEKLVGEAQRKAEEPFYLVKTIETETVAVNKLVLTVGTRDADLKSTTFNFTDVDISTIAAGQVMPVDDFSYHELYGKITSYNGRLIIERPVTFLSAGHLRSLALEDGDGYEISKIETEDGAISHVPVSVDKLLRFDPVSGLISRGIISYPDRRGTLAGGSRYDESNVLFASKYLRANSLHNMALSFDFDLFDYDAPIFINNPEDTIFGINSVYSLLPQYGGFSYWSNTWQGVGEKYSSENRIQFSEAGEFSVWPVELSNRIGEGRIMAVGSNSVNPSNAEIIAPLIIGTSDGVFTINFDPSGERFIASITKTANLPYISSETLQIEGFLLFVSDKGLMAIQNGDIINLTIDHFPDQGDGDFPLAENVYAGYNALTNDFFGGANPYLIDDIINYMKGAVLAYDGRRDNIWCSNASYDYSLVYNMPTQTWTMSTLVFRKKVEFFSVVDTIDGEVFSRYMVVDKTNTKLFALSAEDSTKEVDVHLLTRPFKFDLADEYKMLSRMFSRCLLIRADEGSGAYFALGLWGKNDINKFKKSVPIATIKDNRDEVFTSNVRHDIPVSCRKGKYKSITALFTGKVLPDSDITAFDFEVYKHDNKKMR
nr:hypothetical protein [uncultured Draconibacterium sp.]